MSGLQGAKHGNRAPAQRRASAPPEPGPGEAPAGWERACPTTVPKLAALPVPQRHTTLMLAVGGPSLATAGATGAGLAERTGAQARLLSPGPWLWGSCHRLPPWPATLPDRRDARASEGSQVITRSLSLLSWALLQPAPLVTLAEEVSVAPGTRWLV